MDKGYMIGAAITYALFILLTSWLIMIGLGMIDIQVSYIATTILLIAVRFAYVIVKGSLPSE